jgi:hypothetical protein
MPHTPSLVLCAIFDLCFSMHIFLTDVVSGMSGAKLCQSLSDDPLCKNNVGFYAVSLFLFAIILCTGNVDLATAH